MRSDSISGEVTSLHVYDFHNIQQLFNRKTELFDEYALAKVQCLPKDE